jgi:hypothetical protein
VEFRGVLEIIKRAKDKWDMHIEIITNLIPDIREYVLPRVWKTSHQTPQLSDSGISDERKSMPVLP